MFLLQGTDEVLYFGLELHDGFALTRIFLYGSQQQEDEWHKNDLIKTPEPSEREQFLFLCQRQEGYKNITISNYLIDLSGFNFR